MLILDVPTSRALAFSTPILNEISKPADWHKSSNYRGHETRELRAAPLREGRYGGHKPWEQSGGVNVNALLFTACGLPFVTHLGDLQEI